MTSIPNLLRRLWRREGMVDGRTYALVGVGAFAIKYAIDWSIARFVFDRSWHLVNYWQVRLPTNRHPEQAEFDDRLLLTLLVLALPFIWLGVSMTILRLRDARLPPGLVTVFFLPVLNLTMFLALSLAASAPSPATNGSPVSRETGDTEDVVTAIVITTIFGVVCAGVSTWLFRSYGSSLFVGLPFCVGFVAAVVGGKRHPQSPVQPTMIALLTLVVIAGVLLAVAWEGIICLALASPIGLVLATFGALCGQTIQRHGGQPPATIVLAALLPIVMLGETAMPRQPPAYAVRTAIDIAAPPERVWSNVVSFGTIPEPPAWYFRAGLAYPVRATMVGSGRGAVRYCSFTTSDFVEPIRVWDPPRRLAFAVTSVPPPMTELTPWHDVHPPHIDGFFVSHKGSFDLLPLEGGGTRVIGTTWYRHGLWPAAYWRVWSDAIIHRIHLRVLRHVQRLSERPADV